MSKEYNSYINEHLNNVRDAYLWLQEHRIIKTDIDDQIYLHDDSKYSDDEYRAYDKYFYGKRTKKVKEDFDYAWLHHIHNNPHHWQYWVLVNDDDGTIGLEMPEEYVIEMICDWWSFSWKTNNLYEIFNWYENHKNKMILHNKTKKLVEDILDKIKEILDNEQK